MSFREYGMDAAFLAYDPSAEEDVLWLHGVSGEDVCRMRLDMEDAVDIFRMLMDKSREFRETFTGW